jgi:hypothetical protein
VLICLQDPLPQIPPFTFHRFSALYARRHRRGEGLAQIAQQTRPCDADENNPPAGFVPLIEIAKTGTLVDRFFVPQLNDKDLARGPKGVGSVYSYAEKLSDETIEIYLRPLVETELKKAQVSEYTVALGQNALVPVREQLRAWKGPARMVWGLKDNLFGLQWLNGWIRTCRVHAACAKSKTPICSSPKRCPT